ncbi:DUF2171 domain-containing protein [Dictyobacter aurantiacus]|uniref:PRC-barrel domain-containing protein n=1 Tax=Dictyobacter aurantiacus TaxID=1936993 RepID=A0A401ZJ27_9CHLR|nr:DUF2171 domain-containing protein [Dictyobacter aurantiacus]GCE06856.1 hypothetical protein KDAU_41850 [Dictyobacter aurantiacus]
MASFTQQNVHKHMSVYSSDNDKLGHVGDVYEDSFKVHKGFIFTQDRYIPYSAIEQIEGDTIHLQLTSDEAQAKEWTKRPDYEDHLGDPTQLMYDRGHGVRDPFDEVNPDQS